MSDEGWDHDVNGLKTGQQPQADGRTMLENVRATMIKRFETSKNRNETSSVACGFVPILSPSFLPSRLSGRVACHPLQCRTRQPPKVTVFHSSMCTGFSRDLGSTIPVMLYTVPWYNPHQCTACMCLCVHV